LLRAMLLASANDAAHTLAVDVGGSVEGFVRLMNRRARALRLRHTHYATPVGLDTSSNYSSASDLARVAEVVMRDRFLARTVGRAQARLSTGAHPRVVVNGNDLVGRYSFVSGVKP